MALRRATHVAWRRVGDETVLIHLKSKQIYVLNPSGGYFWHLLDGRDDAPAMLAGLESETSVPADARGAVDRFIAKLAEADLVERAGPVDVAEKNDAPVYPLPEFVAPELVWQEELRNFGQSCARDPGMNAICDASPTF